MIPAGYERERGELVDSTRGHLCQWLALFIPPT